MTVEISSVVEWVADLHASRLIDGLTISGGEPMEQAGALLAFLQALRLRVPEISIGMFSGYTQRELASGTFLSLDANPPHTKPTSGVPFDFTSILQSGVSTVIGLRINHWSAVRTKSCFYFLIATPPRLFAAECRVHDRFPGDHTITGFPILQ
jgi:hypothetical protein